MKRRSVAQSVQRSPHHRPAPTRTGCRVSLPTVASWDVRVRVLDEETDEIIAHETRPRVRVCDADGAVRYGNRDIPMTLAALIQEGDNQFAAEQRKAAALTAR